MQPEEYGKVSLELAGDELTPAQICEAYSKAQGSNVSHFSPPKFLFWFLNRLVFAPPSVVRTHCDALGNFCVLFQCVKCSMYSYGGSLSRA